MTIFFYLRVLRSFTEISRLLYLLLYLLSLLGLALFKILFCERLIVIVFSALRDRLLLSSQLWEINWCYLINFKRLILSFTFWEIDWYYLLKRLTDAAFLTDSGSFERLCFLLLVLTVKVGFCWLCIYIQIL